MYGKCYYPTKQSPKSLTRLTAILSFKRMKRRPPTIPKYDHTVATKVHEVKQIYQVNTNSNKNLPKVSAGMQNAPTIPKSMTEILIPQQPFWISFPKSFFGLMLIIRIDMREKKRKMAKQILKK